MSSVAPRPEVFDGVHLIGPDGASSDKVVVEVSLNGMKILTASGSHALKDVSLKSIDKWDLRGSLLTVDLKREAGGSELVLTGEGRTMTELLDTLVSYCVQAAELMEDSRDNSRPSQPRREPTAAAVGDKGEGVRFWERPEKEGWMQSQGERIKTWRKRWFVLKDGFLFRFLAPGVTAASKPRGVLNLNKCTDVSDASAETGKPSSIRVVAEKEKHLFLVNSETEAVEWISSFEGAMHKAVRQQAGLEHPHAGGKDQRDPEDWMSRLNAQLESHNSRSRAAPATNARRSDDWRGSAGNKSYDDAYDRVDASWGNIPTVGSSSHHSSGRGLDRYAPPTSRPNPTHISIEALDYEPVDIDALAAQHAPHPAGHRADYPGAPYRGDPGQGYPGGAYVGGTYAGGPYAAAGYGAAGAGAPMSAPPQYGQGYDTGYGQAYGQAGAQQTGAWPQQQQQQQQDMGQLVGGGQSQSQAQGAWQVYHTEDGRPYYYNAGTGQTQWEPPASNGLI